MNTTTDTELQPADAAGLGTGTRWWQRRWGQWAVVFGVWTVLAFVFTGMLYYSQLLGERPMTWREARRIAVHLPLPVGVRDDGRALARAPLPARRAAP